MLHIRWREMGYEIENDYLHLVYSTHEIVLSSWNCYQELTNFKLSLLPSLHLIAVVFKSLQWTLFCGCVKNRWSEWRSLNQTCLFYILPLCFDIITFFFFFLTFLEIKSVFVWCIDATRKSGALKCSNPRPSRLWPSEIWSDKLQPCEIHWRGPTSFSKFVVLYNTATTTTKNNNLD